MINLTLTPETATAVRSVVDKAVAENRVDAEQRLALKQFSLILESQTETRRRTKPAKPRTDYNMVPWKGFKNLRGEKRGSVRNAFCRMAANILLEHGTVMKASDVLAKADSSLTRLYSELGRDVPAMISSHFLNAVRKHSQFHTPKRGLVDLSRDVKQTAGVSDEMSIFKLAETKNPETGFNRLGIYDIADDPDNRTGLTRTMLVKDVRKIAAAIKENGGVGLKFRGKSYGQAQALYFFGAALHDIFCIRPEADSEANRGFGGELFLKICEAAGYSRDWGARTWKDQFASNSRLGWRYQGIKAFLDANKGAGK